MSPDRILDALALPPATRVDQRVPKKLLVENGAPTAADKRQINDGIEELTWLAALKPTTIGVPLYRDAIREYLEIAVLRLTLRPAAKAARLIELVHRAIPYPVFLIVRHGDASAVSLAPKRWSQGEGNRVVVETVQTSPDIDDAAPSSTDTAFLASLILANQPATDLQALYLGWLGCLTSLAVSRITGHYLASGSPDAVTAIRESLTTHERLAAEIARLRGEASRQRQLNRRVALNLEIKRLESQLAALLQSLATAHESR